jgi:beta-lactamase regulating signal transducer with metallopeptidase domain
MNEWINNFDWSSAIYLILNWLGQAVLFGSLVAVITWSALKLFGKRLSPAMHGLLWVIVLLKFLIPVGPGFAWSLANISAAVTGWNAPVSAAPGAQTSAIVEQDGFWISIDPDEEMSAATTGIAGSDWRDWIAYSLVVITIAYLAGLAISLGYRTYWVRRFARQCRRYPLASLEIKAVVAMLCRRMNIRRQPTTRISDEAPAPFVFGAFRPTLVLSRRQLDNGAELEAVVLHEIAHLRMADLVIRYVQWFAGTMLYFWPVVAWVNRKIDLAREHACDEWALRHGRLSAGQYARCLLRALHPTGIRQPAYMPATMAANLSTIERRIDMIMESPRRSRIRRAVCIPAVVVMAAWAGIVLTGVAAAEEEPAPQEEQRRVMVFHGEDGNDITMDVDVHVAGEGVEDIELIEADGMPTKVIIRKSEDGPGRVGNQVIKFHGNEFTWNPADMPPGVRAEKRVVFGHGDGDKPDHFVFVGHLSPALLEDFLVENPNADIDGDGTLTKDEHDAYLVALALEDPDAVLEQYPQADGDEDGVLSGREAYRLVAGHMMAAFHGRPATGATIDLKVEDDGEQKSFVIKRVEHHTEDIDAGVPVEGNVTLSTRVEAVVDSGDGIPPRVAQFTQGNGAPTASSWLADNIEFEPTEERLATAMEIVREMGHDRFDRILEKHPDADSNGDGTLTMQELHDFFMNMVEQRGNLPFGKGVTVDVLNTHEK